MTIKEAKNRTLSLTHLLDIILDSFQSNKELVVVNENMKSLLITAREKFVKSYYISDAQINRIDHLINTDLSGIGYADRLTKIEKCFIDILAIAENEITENNQERNFEWNRLKELRWVAVNA